MHAPLSHDDPAVFAAPVPIPVPIKDRLFAEAADPQPGSVRKPFLLGLLCGMILVLILGQVFRAVGPEPDIYAPARTVPDAQDTLPADDPVPELSPQAMADASGQDASGKTAPG